MRKYLFIVVSFACSLLAYGQSVDKSINEAINKSQWFELRELYQNHSAEVQTAVLHPLSKFFIHHFFNQPDSALYYADQLLTKHQAELGGSASSFIFLMSQNFAKLGQYTNAAGILEQYNGMFRAQNLEPNPLFVSYEKQYQAIAELGGFRTHRPAKDIQIPISYRDEAGKPSLIQLGTRINGQAHQAVWDTGAGENIISLELAEALKLPIFDFAGTEVVSTVGVSQSAFTIIDSLQLGEIVYTHVPFQVLQMKGPNAEANAQIKRMGLDFILGVPCMLALEEIQFDFKHNLLRIPAQPSPAPAFAPNLCCSVERTFIVSILDKRSQKTIEGLLDTGSVSTTLTSRYYAANADLLRDFSSTETLRTAGMGGVKTAQVISTSWEYSIDGTHFQKEPIRIEVGSDTQIKPIYDCVLGTPSLSKYDTVTLNFKDMYLRFDQSTAE